MDAPTLNAVLTQRCDWGNLQFWRDVVHKLLPAPWFTVSRLVLDIVNSPGREIVVKLTAGALPRIHCRLPWPIVIYSNLLPPELKRVDSVADPGQRRHSELNAGPLTSACANAFDEEKGTIDLNNVFDCSSHTLDARRRQTISDAAIGSAASLESTR